MFLTTCVISQNLYSIWLFFSYLPCVCLTNNPALQMVMDAIRVSKLVLCDLPNIKYCFHSLKVLCKALHNASRCLKTDLDLRPIYHQKDESCEAHLFFGLLSYWVVNTIRHQLKQKGIRHHWTELTRIMSTQKAVTTTAVNKPGERVAFRNCTLPKSKVVEIYDTMNYQHQPFKRRKICTPQTYPPEYSSCCTAISSA